LLSLLGALVAFWLLIGATRCLVAAFAAEPNAAGSSRYIYPAGVLILLLMVEVVAGLRLRVATLAAVSVVIVTIFALDIREFSRQNGRYEITFDQHLAELVKLERSRGRIPPIRSPGPVKIPYVRAGPYFAAIDDLGSPVQAPAPKP
jgi:hypothetical protein